MLVTIICFFIYNPIAKKLNESSLTAVAEVKKVDGRWITYNFRYDYKNYVNSFKVASSHWDSLNVGDLIFVRFHDLDPEINYSIYPEHKVTAELERNSISDTLTETKITWWWIANHPK